MPDAESRLSAVPGPRVATHQPTPPIQGNCLICAIGRLYHLKSGGVELDFGDGRLGITSDDAKLKTELDQIGDQSLVTISGTLRKHSWQVGDGAKREAIQLVAHRLILLYDARRGRMVL